MVRTDSRRYRQITHTPTDYGSFLVETYSTRQQKPSGTKKGGAGKLIEDHFDEKVPGEGCCKHSTERLHNELFRHEFGRTTSPEECFAKRFKAWFNAADDKDCENVGTRSK